MTASLTGGCCFSIMKKIFAALLVTLILTSCATSRVMSFTTPEGPRLYIRPTVLKGGYEVKADLNVPCTDFRISGDATLNYSVFFPAGSEKDIRSAVLVFTVNGKTFRCENSELLFLESAGGGKQEARFTSVLGPEAAGELIGNPEGVSVSLIIADRAMELNASALTEALKELSLSLL